FVRRSLFREFGVLGRECFLALVAVAAEIARGLLARAAVVGLLVRSAAARALQDIFLVGIGVDQRFERLVEVGQLPRLAPRINLVARAVVGRDLAFLDLEGIAEARLDHIGR